MGKLGLLPFIFECFFFVLYNQFYIIFQCLANLAQWDDLETVASAAIDDGEPPNLNKVWDDTFFQVKTWQIEVILLLLICCLLLLPLFVGVLYWVLVLLCSTLCPF